eukprot:PhF_6_TR33456/c0_g1_i1/m.48801
MSGRPRTSGKAMFSQKRAKIHPMYGNPLLTQQLINKAYTTDPMKATSRLKTYVEYGKPDTDAPRLEGIRSKEKIEKQADKSFDLLGKFLEGKRYDRLSSARQLQRFCDTMVAQDTVIVWLCMSAMAVLNPGNLHNRVLYQHLKSLVKAVATEQMHPRTAFYFYENAIKSPAFRTAATQTHLMGGASTRLAGICAGAEALKELNVCARPMQPYFELYQRIAERSELFTPWGFPPLYQFEERLEMMQRLRPFSRSNIGSVQNQRKKRKGLAGTFLKYYANRVVWMPPSISMTRNYQGNFLPFFRGVIPD